ncbi:MAG TPA: hypothetical protein ENN49_10200 [Bacteroidales bacterium]|nr:hypothetical protein [Bacteroidales bacterium]
MNERKFAKDDNIQTNRTEYGVKNLYRYANLFKIPEQEVLNLFKDIPFLNGGLFDCLDKPNDEDKIIYVDGFSRNAKKQAHVPDYLFFDDGQETKLNETYQTSNNSYNCKGLINLLESYKFTVAENTPLEEEIALDPELLGKVFEELLANYNPETQTTARKQTGSFYTPREIVDYMVDESLLEYLKGALSIPADGEDDNDRFSAHEFFNPNNEIQIHQGNLPHWQQENVWYFVTFRLADSIPTEVAEQIKVEREIWLKNNSKNPNSEYSKEQLKEYNRLFSDRVEKLLNDYHGSCILKNKEIANIVKNAIENFNNQRYLLDEWVIMPNHVHILVKPLAENKLSDILHSWKSFTANEINKALNKKGQVWMHESYDHIVRNERAFRAIRNYIRQNPVKAKLAEGEFLISESKAERSKDTSATLEQRLRDLLSYSENSNPFNEAETQQLIAAINNCKILDPACGSGAFPMGILHKMVHILQKIDPNNKKWKAQQKEKIIGDQIKQLENDKKAIEGLSDKAVREKAIQAVDERLKEIREIFESKNYFDDYARKLYLIENCIYGIDIQPIAVQIAKLRFFISLIIDQDKDPTQENLGFRSLPNLETKFVAANTLIGLDKPQQFAIRNPQIDETEKQLKQLRHEYFTANTRKKKLKLQAKDKNLRKQIAELLKNDGWPSLVAEQISSFDPYDQNHFANWFDPEWMFGHDLKNGFDIVIGNPPYIQLQKAFNYKNKYADLYKDQNYKTFDRTGDIYCLFYEKGIQLLKENGLLAYITSNKWMRAGYGEKLREFFIKHKPLQLVDLGPGVFQNATVDTNILIIQKFASRVSAEVSSPSKDASDTLAVTLQKEDKDDITKALTEKGVRLTKLTKDAWFIGSDAEQKLKAKIEKIGKPLKEWDVKIYRGVLTGLNKAFIITTEKRDEILNNCQDEDERIRTEAIIKPILRGRDIKRYHYQWAGLWVIFIPWHFPLHEDLTIQGTSEKAEKEFQKKYPSIYHHLLQFKDALSKRNKEETGIRYEWYAMQRCAATYYPEFEKEKVAFKAVGKNLTFSLFKPGTMISAPASFMTSNFNKYILGLLCSSFTFYFVLKNADKTGAGDVMLNVQSFQKIPLPPITSTTEPIVNQIEALVDKILEAKKQNPEADTRQREKEIDQLVYKLYDLTEEEIKIIEGGE